VASPAVRHCASPAIHRNITAVRQPIQCFERLLRRFRTAF
jgi:hypothetical protein